MWITTHLRWSQVRFLPELFADAVDLTVTCSHQLSDLLCHLRVEAGRDDSILGGEGGDVSMLLIQRC